MSTTLRAPPANGRARSSNAPRQIQRQRLKVRVRGAVQGVGFRPFLYRLASEFNLKGWVVNSSQGVFAELEGPRAVLDAFLIRLSKEKPPRAIIQNLESSFLDPIGYDTFEIRNSETAGDKTALILPDVATCADCLREILDPNNRRFRYPFTNCTNCGPRFSIIEALPYDRANTSMKKFAMCDQCDREYHDPLDRRFHAQPNACPTCGPHLELWSENGGVIATHNDALRFAAEAVSAGRILALRGVGGFQLIVDARNDAAVVRLRERKHREEKPFALMYPSLAAVRADCEISELEEHLLSSSEAPIVLLEKKSAIGTRQLAISVAPGNPNLGIMLPPSPLHHLLMRELNFPIVATSGNLSDEPICIDEREALQRLRRIADVFLIHDREIVRHVDDSIVRVMSGREMILRRARGYAPLPISVGPLCQAPNQSVSHKGRTILAVGAHLKNTVALKIGNNIFVSQHIGDLETKEAHEAFRRTCADLPRLYDASVDLVTCDMHPDYLSTKHARDFPGAAPSSSPESHSVVWKPPLLEAIQHHFAHVAACMAENHIEPPALGIAWDGTGYGLDGTIWGGEFLLAKNDGSFERVAHFRHFRLPGGDRAIKEPRRCALGLLYEIFGEHAWDCLPATVDFSKKEKSLLRQILEKQINAPLTSSAGRLFDAVAALLGLRRIASFEGQAAMELEFARQSEVADAYSFAVITAAPIVVDWEPAIRELIDDVATGESAGFVSAKFHNGLVEAALDVARRIGERKVVLSGGCFQNRYLTERAVQRLGEQEFQPYWHRQVPPNDGGIALGQAIAASWKGRS
jgi:hydrogenase maturation protein HypF